jgi:hypothetical protein
LETTRKELCDQVSWDYFLIPRHSGKALAAMGRSTKSLCFTLTRETARTSRLDPISSAERRRVLHRPLIHRNRVATKNAFNVACDVCQPPFANSPP